MVQSAHRYHKSRKTNYQFEFKKQTLIDANIPTQDKTKRPQAKKSGQ